ncbi:helix-turn-helix transcriptional regulator [Kitasatospora sp. NPDC090308]|uniref:helix-turn-helix transcriptional regulator n=1 Tax=Kitasatospora sp. NPDC090308 TaxID=3364082 RepID=UPI0037FD5A7D
MTSRQRPSVARPLHPASSVMPPALPSRYLGPEDVAVLFGLPLETVHQWRRKRTGPSGFRVGRHLCYDPNAVAQWVADQTGETA